MASKVKALQQWCKLQVEGYRDVNITNMTSSWKSGLAFCALIHRYRPDLIDYDSLSKENVYENNKLAFEVAKEQLGVPDLLEAEDMVAMAVPDKLCIVTYVSQFYNVFKGQTPAGGPGEKRSPLKRPQVATSDDVTEPKRITMEPQPAKAAQRNAINARSPSKQSMGDKCHICHQKVYLMERHLEGGKLYHRHCFRESQKSSFRAYRVNRGQANQDIKENISPTNGHSSPAPAPSNLNGGGGGGGGSKFPAGKAGVGSPTAGAAAPSTRSMAKMWDTKIASEVRRPSPASTPTAAAASSRTSSGTSSPTLSDISTKVQSPGLPSPSAGAAAASSPASSSRPQTWASKAASPLSPRSPRPWSPGSASTPSTASVSPSVPRKAPCSSPLSPVSSVFSSPSPPPSSASSSASTSNHSSPRNRRRLAVNTAAGPLSPSAEGLFPHFSDHSASSRAVPAAPVEMMEVDEDPPGAAAAAAAAAAAPASSSGGPRSVNTATTNHVHPRRLPSEGPTVLSPDPGEAALKSGLLQSLSNIRQRFDTNKDARPPRERTPSSGGAEAADSATRPSSINSARPEQPRSILKTGAETAPQHHELASRGPRPILKNKESTATSTTTTAPSAAGSTAAAVARDSDMAKSADGRPLKSILKSMDGDGGVSSSLETSPRSILKHHEDSGSGGGGGSASESSSPRSANHGILKGAADVGTGGGDSGGESVIAPKSILKTAGPAASGGGGGGGLAHRDETSSGSSSSSGTSRVVRSILKPRKSSVDSLLGSSGDELDELSPRPILKPSSRDSAVSPSSEPRSILKTNTGDNTLAHESPKPILKSRESSPVSAMSTLKTVEPVRPILKKPADKPTPKFNATSHPPIKSPTGPSVLHAPQSDGSPKQSSPFAAFKSQPSKKSYQSSDLGLLSKRSESDDDKPVNNMSAFNVEDSIAIAKAHRHDKDSGSKPKPARPASSPATGAKKLEVVSPKGKALGVNVKERTSTLPEKTDSRPEWIIEAEKRQAARRGRYDDPEKKYLKKQDEEGGSEKLNMARALSPPRNTTRGPGGARAKSSTLAAGSTAGGSGGGLKITLPAPGESSTDEQPEWMKEAEKRRALRSNGYPDPEKPQNARPKPARPPTSPAAASKAKLPGWKAGAEHGKKTENHPLPGVGAVNRASGVAPPKPLRSPVPQRASNVDQRASPRKPAWRTDVTKSAVDAKDAEAGVVLRKAIRDLQEKKKSPAPPRPAQPPSVGGGTAKKVIPAPKFSELEDASRALNGQDNQYAEIGPPSRRRPGRRGPGQGDSLVRDSKFANRPLPPVPADQDPNAPIKRRVNAEARISSSALMRMLEDLDVQLQDLEKEGRVLEEKIRSESDDAMDEADLMVAWFELVNQKNELVRRESDLMYKQRQQELEDQHEELEYEFRCLMEKPESEKTVSDKIREEALLQELMETVSMRNNIVDSIEEDRIRYLEEDQEIAVMMEAKGFSYKEESRHEDLSPKAKSSKDKRKEEKKKSKGIRVVKSCVN